MVLFVICFSDLVECGKVDILLLLNALNPSSALQRIEIRTGCGLIKAIGKVWAKILGPERYLLV